MKERTARPTPLPEPRWRQEQLPVAGLVSQDPVLRQEVPQALSPAAAVVHLDPSDPLPCTAPVQLLLLDGTLLARASRLPGSLPGRCTPTLLILPGGGLERYRPWLPRVADFVAWPCPPSELRLRAERLLALGRERAGLVACGSVVVDGERLEAWVAGRALRLTSREFRLLQELAARCDRPVHRQELLSAVWGWEAENSSNVVDAGIASLRRKLAAQAGIIRTIRGVGYRLVP